MLPAPFSRCLVLTGPTGSGKTELSLELAEKLRAEIICMDSMTLYRGMDIGTAKPSTQARQRVDHHLLDTHQPWECASVAWWLRQATRIVGEIESRDKRALFVGGTPLYLKALVAGLFDGPPRDEALRKTLEAEDSSTLHEQVERVDPVTAARLHPNDRRRLVRALEVWKLTGKPISSWQTQWGAIPAPGARSLPQVLCLELPRQELHHRINQRAEQMLANGLVEEAKSLESLSHPLSREAAQAVGYAECALYLRGCLSRKELLERIQARGRQLAKKQLTWLRHLPGVTWTTNELTFAAWQLRIHS